MAESDITLGEIARRLSGIERKLEGSPYVDTKVFDQYAKLIHEQNNTQNERLASLEQWRTSVYALLGTAYLGIIGAVIVSFIR